MNTERGSTQPTIELTDAAETLPITDDTTTGMTADASSPDVVAPDPRTRWAAIVWGVVFATVAWAGIWVLTSSARRDDVTDWFAGLTPGTITAVSLLSMGVLVLIAGLVGLIRHAQRHRSP